jgi:hypothetical protein
MDHMNSNLQLYDQLKIDKPTTDSVPQISFINDFQGALSFLRTMPPYSAMRQDIDFLLAMDSRNHARSFQKETDNHVAHQLAIGQLVIVNRFHNRGDFHNFKRRPKEKFESAPPAPPPAPPPREFTWVEIELVDAGGKAVPNESYEIVLPNGRLHSGRTDTLGRARIENIVKPGTCKFSFPELEDDDWSSA